MVFFSMEQMGTDRYKRLLEKAAVNRMLREKAQHEIKRRSRLFTIVTLIVPKRLFKVDYKNEK